MSLMRLTQVFTMTPLSWSKYCKKYCIFFHSSLPLFNRNTIATFFKSKRFLPSLENFPLGEIGNFQATTGRSLGQKPVWLYYHAVLTSNGHSRNFAQNGYFYSGPPLLTRVVQVGSSHFNEKFSL